MNLLTSMKTLKDYRRDPLVYIEELHRKLGHHMFLEVFGKKVYVISHPDDIIHVLKTNNAAYEKGRTTKALAKLLGKGLVTNEGNSWRKQHRLIRPVMNIKSVYDLAPKMLESTLEFVDEIKDQKEINAFREMNRLTWRIVLKTLFSQEINPEMDVWLEDILHFLKLVTKKTRTAIPLPYWVPTQDNRKLKQVLTKFDEYVFGLIKHRRVSEPKNDLLQLLIDAQEEGTHPMTDLEIRDEIMTFMMAGHETITNTMSWAMIELAKHPEYASKLKPEAEAFFKDKNFEALNSSLWHTAVIDEVMRLWPPIWVFMRQAQTADQLLSMKIPKGANVVLAPYLTHRSKDFWTDPEKFLPERFFPAEKKKISPGIYYPFGLGPRACIGAHFAGMEAKIILASLIHHFDWEIVSKVNQTYEAGISLRPVSNIMMKLSRRNS